MRSFFCLVATGAFGLLLSSCQSNRAVVAGAIPEQSSSIAVPSLGDPFPDYVIGPQDVLSIRVFREPDLSLDNVRVDSGGRFELALIGRIVASNKTPDALSAEITERYARRYLVNPNVAVNVQEVNSKRLAVEGEVENPGVFQLSDKSNLLSALALAGGPTDTAKLNQVAVFRTVSGQKMVAVFDLAKIRSGEMANPDILAGDIVVVGFSRLRQGFQDFLGLAPLLSIFRPFN